MKVKVVNRSSKKTRDRIKKAFALLMKEKGTLNKITVTDLVKEADMTRSSFYTHYDNIYEVANELHNDTLEVLVENIDKLQDMKNIDFFFDEIFKYLKENEEIYSLILSSDDPLFFTRKLNKIITQKLYESFNYSIDKNGLDLKLNLFIDGCISLVIKHFRGEIPNSLDDINKNMKEICKNLFIDE